MATPPNHILKRIFNYAKWFITIGLIWVIYRYFVKNNPLPEVWSLIKEKSITIYLVAILFSFFNWFVESIKWKIMVSNLEKISLKTAFTSTLAGAAVANIIPFRVGEYLGRMIYIHKENRLASALNSIAASMCQMLVTVVMGLPFLALYIQTENKKIAWYGIVPIAMVIILAALLIWYSKTNRNPKWNKWIQKLIEDIRSFTWQQLFWSLLLSFGRYGIFSCMYVWLLHQFGLSLSFSTLFGAVATILFMQSFTPGMVLVDAGIRTAIPLLVLQAYEANLQSEIMAAATINYLSNVFLPALVGAIFLLYKKSKDLDE